MNEWASLVVSWLPFILLIGAWFWLSRRNGMQVRGPSGAAMIELYERQVDESRRINAKLERFAAALELYREASWVSGRRFAHAATYLKPLSCFEASVLGPVIPIFQV
jgi:hypothetical protein